MLEQNIRWPPHVVVDKMHLADQAGWQKKFVKRSNEQNTKYSDAMETGVISRSKTKPKDKSDSKSDFDSDGVVEDLLHQLLGNKDHFDNQHYIPPRPTGKKRQKKPKMVSREAKDLVLSLLSPRVEERIGCGQRGSAEIKEHPFFEGFDWEKLQQKHVIPPFKPPVSRKPLTCHFLNCFY